MRGGPPPAGCAARARSTGVVLALGGMLLLVAAVLLGLSELSGLVTGAAGVVLLMFAAQALVLARMVTEVRRRAQGGTGPDDPAGR